MREKDSLAARFEDERPRLHAVAYRMLGSLAEADDAVQNAWLRLGRADIGAVDNLSGWLTTVVARECLKLLRSRRHRREEALTEGAAARSSVTEAGNRSDSGDPEAQVLLADSVGPALMIVLDSLAPAERLAFVLHDVFAIPFDQIAPILERSPAATRQLASRARRRVHGAEPPLRSDLARQRPIVDAFLTALRGGDFEGLIAILDPDVVLHDDSPTPPAAEHTYGARAVGEHALRYQSGARFVQLAVVDGAVGLAILPGGRLLGALAFTFDHDRIVRIEAISDPQRLQHVDPTGLTS